MCRAAASWSSDWDFRRFAITAPDICSRNACQESCGSDRPVACCRSKVASRRAFVASADPFSGFVFFAWLQIQVARDRVPLGDDLNRNADRKTKIAVCAPLVDRYLGEPV